MKILIKISGTFPATLYGGTQRVMWGLGKQLALMGHKVCYLVDKVVSDCPFAELRVWNPELPLALQVPESTDVVHLNEYYEGMETLSKPHVITIHGNRPPESLDSNVIFVSENHARRYGSSSFVLNGIDWDELPVLDLAQTRRDFHFLGKTTHRSKNIYGAIDVVLRLPHQRLHVLGGHRFYISHGIHATFSPRIRFHGMVDDAGKYACMTHSKGLVFPVTWHEPFGLAVIESLYAGCPVFATPYGALPEIIKDPSLGFLTTSAAAMAEHMKDLSAFSPQHCHEYAREMFSARRMAKDYVEKYEQVLNGRPLNGHFGPRTDKYRALAWEKE